MKKLSLHPDQLRAESFSRRKAPPAGRGTVAAHLATLEKCDTHPHTDAR